MNFLIITHVPHLFEQNRYCAYAPYVREMNIWNQQFDQISIVAPESRLPKSAIDVFYNHKNIRFIPIQSFDVLHFKSSIRSFFKIPKIAWKIFKAMQKADHIHLRCPGNIGLLGCFVQIVFPNKIKTAKYAGNWDPNAKQPWTYKLQKWILSNTFLSKNIQVLVYGQWEGSSKNILPFFTATYNESDKLPILSKELQQQIRFVFVGTLSSGKNPLYAIQLVKALILKQKNVFLTLYGEGKERTNLEAYIAQNNLENAILLAGNQTQEVVKSAYQQSHFVILPSQSEGWPKAVAEGMFWGCVPVATGVSCVPFMLDYGRRGLLLEGANSHGLQQKNDFERDVLQLENLLDDEIEYIIKSQKAVNWSRKYTLDVFEDSIRKIIV